MLTGLSYGYERLLPAAALASLRNRRRTPWSAIQRLRAVDSSMPLKSLGGNTLNLSLKQLERYCARPSAGLYSHMLKWSLKVPCNLTEISPKMNRPTSTLLVSLSRCSEDVRVPARDSRPGSGSSRSGLYRLTCMNRYGFWR